MVFYKKIFIPGTVAAANRKQIRVSHLAPCGSGKGGLHCPNCRVPLRANVTVYSKKTTKKDGKLVRSPEFAWRDSMIAALKGFTPPGLKAAMVSWEALFERPSIHIGTGRNAGTVKPSFAGRYHLQKPDRDNIDKVVLDVLQELGWFADDSSVASGILIKRWADPGQEPGMVLQVVKL